MPDLATNVLYSNRDYNVTFRDESGNATDAQLLASKAQGQPTTGDLT